MRERVRIQRQAEVRTSTQPRAKQLSVVRTRILAERRETVNSIRLVAEQLDAECEHNIERRRWCEKLFLR